jgi:DNA-binding CsgD family transcriptional regulator
MPTSAGLSNKLSDLLTPQQRRITLLVLEGNTHRQIGNRLGISHRTASIHLANIYQQLGIHSKIELVQMLYGIHANAASVVCPTCQRPFPPGLSHRRARLTPTQKRVKKLLDTDRTESEIATELGISKYTVRTHARAIRNFERLNRLSDTQEV